MAALTELRLKNFRTYDEACLSGLASNFVVLVGANGAGKTNILEAVSLFSPGKGLRNADLDGLQKIGSQSGPWAISAKISTTYGDIQIGTGRDPQRDRRLVHIQGEQMKSQTVLSEYFSCLWLTPQMDRLFIDATSARRRFLDRMVFSFDASHAGRVTRYENAMSQRSRLLKEGRAEPAWLDALEHQMSETGVAVAAARAEFIIRLQQVCMARGGEDFPVAGLSLSGMLEREIGVMRALELEEKFCHSLKKSRSEDAVYGGASEGPHKTDFGVHYVAKNMPAGQCSTGEQKALLIGIVLAHADLIKGERGDPPLLLLDEVAAHLDTTRRAALYHHLSHIGGQIWMTGTDRMLFESLKGQGVHFEVPFLSKSI